MAKKSSSRSKIHPYLILRNWLQGGSCRFFDNPCHSATMTYNRDMYNEILAQEVSKERGIVMFEPNVQKNKTI